MKPRTHAPTNNARTLLTEVKIARFSRALRVCPEESAHRVLDGRDEEVGVIRTQQVGVFVFEERANCTGAGCRQAGIGERVPVPCQAELLKGGVVGLPMGFV